MRLYTSDEKRSVDVGTGSIWYSIYSTANIIFSEDAKEKVSSAMEFLKNGDCLAEDIPLIAEQLTKLQAYFSLINPELAVYDLHHPETAPPWKGNIAPTVTSCANLYTTADGKDLFTEVIALLQYAAENNVNVMAG